MIHSLAECQATAHQETVFSVLHRKVRLPPESVPAASPYPEAGRLFPAPLQERLFEQDVLQSSYCFLCSCWQKSPAFCRAVILSSVSYFIQFVIGKPGSLLNLLRRHPHFLKLARNSGAFSSAPSILPSWRPFCSRRSAIVILFSLLLLAKGPAFCRAFWFSSVSDVPQFSFRKSGQLTDLCCRHSRVPELPGDFPCF